MEKIKKKLEEIKHNSIYKIEINEELKDYEINILEKSLKNDISKLSRLQYTNIEHIEINLNKKITNKIFCITILLNEYLIFFRVLFPP